MTITQIRRDLSHGYFIAWTNIYSGDILALFDSNDMTIGFISDTQFEALKQSGAVEEKFSEFVMWVEKGESR